MHSFYTYAHARKTDGRIFYIGKGQGKRAHCAATCGNRSASPP